MFWENDHPDQMRLVIAKTVTSPPAHRLVYDLRTGALLDQLRPGLSVTGFILKLHTDAFLDLPGALFFGAMGLLFFAAMVSGVVLYGPFTKKLPFGTIRGERSARVQWLDFHNLMGILTLLWGSVVCLTGSLNTLTTPMVANFQRTDLAAILAPYRDQPKAETPVPVDAALAAALATTPGAKPFSIMFPGSTSATSPHHYAVYIVREGPLAERMFQPVLVEASTGVVTAKIEFPWYLNALLISRPINFGDYGALPLKIIWRSSTSSPSSSRKRALSLDGQETGTFGKQRPELTSSRFVVTAKQSLRNVFCWPIVFGLASIAGLASALFGEGFWDIASWVGLGALPAALVHFGVAGVRRRRRYQTCHLPPR